MRLTIELPDREPPPGGHWVVAVNWADGTGDGGWGFNTRDKAIASLINSLLHPDDPPIEGVAYYYPRGSEDPDDAYTVSVFAEGWTSERAWAARDLQRQRLRSRYWGD